MHDADWLRAFIAERQAGVLAAHHRGASGLETCLSLTRVMDEAVGTAAASLKQDLVRFADAHIAVLALGGYGRAELSPKSDVDIMILCDSSADKSVAGEYATTLLHMLWDAGLELGHSVRSMEEAVALHGVSLDAWVSMLESRRVCGNSELCGSFFAALRSRTANDRWMIGGILADAAARHERYGNSIKLLEPNLKNSAGTLRDVHSVCWLYRTREPDLVGSELSGQTGTALALQRLKDKGVIGGEEYSPALQGLEFLLRTRHEMHFLRGSRQDTLEYNLQREVAEGLGFGPKAELQSVEVFMRQYYLHARVLHRLHKRMLHLFRESIDGGKPARETAVGELFVVRDEMLSLAAGVSSFDHAEKMFSAFVYAAEKELEISPSLQMVIERSMPLVSEEVRISPSVASMFARILRSKRVAATLRSMNDLGMLGAYIPEFGELVAFFQHNVYHYFTADEHTLLAIDVVEKLREQQGVLHDVWRNLKRKDVLYLAVLLHDIAKPRGVADHEHTGVAMAETILKRLGMDDAIPDVSFLVRNHLVMEQVAFRRNVHDAETIREFAARFERPEQLDSLYLLTYADLSAVNTNVWTEWKASLLQELYRRTSEVLLRQLRGTAVDAFHQLRHEAAVGQTVSRIAGVVPREDVQRHLDLVRNMSYIAVFSDDEVQRHIRAIETLETMETVFVHREGYTELTILAHDAPFILSQFCAVLSANDANIFDANIFTRDDGVVIDRFRVVDAASGKELPPAVCEKIREDLKGVLEGKTGVEHLFAAHKRKWKRRPRIPSNPNTRTGVEFEQTEGYTIIDVYASDAVGLLYRITETLSRLGLDIFFARIATRVDGVVDAFYTRERAGNVQYTVDRRNTIQVELMKTIREIAGQELGE